MVIWFDNRGKAPKDYILVRNLQELEYALDIADNYGYCIEYIDCSSQYCNFAGKDSIGVKLLDFLLERGTPYKVVIHKYPYLD